MIKAIETRYKGYRFRSRLEARWAVYFDALGLEWEYEPEGFDLGNGDYYLPDFRVIENGSYKYFEIKAPNGFTPNVPLRSAYLAGKIQSDSRFSVINMWRRSIADKRFLGQKYEFYAEDPDTRNFYPGFVYSGPNFSDNHGSMFVHSRAKHQIQSCDFLFAWIDSVDSFGTFHEIGFADAVGKPVYIGYSKEMPVDDMWFLSASAKMIGVFEDASTAWDSLAPIAPPANIEEAKIVEFSIYRNITLVMGDPRDCRIYQYSGGGFKFIPDVRVICGTPMDSHIDAAAKARSARFEHGESP